MSRRRTVTGKKRDYWRIEGILEERGNTGGKREYWRKRERKKLRKPTGMAMQRLESSNKLTRVKGFGL